jgi:outer membrane receptor protein involved in Fe transport
MPHGTIYGNPHFRQLTAAASDPAGYNQQLMFRRISLICCPLFVLLLTAAPVYATEPETEEEEPALREEIEVTANSEGIVLGPRGASTSVLEPAEAGGMPSSVAELATELPGVSENGLGGMQQVISIRGVSRHRIAYMLSGVRLVSERRAGVSFSFLDPLLMGSVQVLRGPATSFHGSGALGGVMQVFPRSFEGLAFDSGYQTGGDENYQMFGLGAETWSAAIAHRQAGDDEAADGSRLNSHFRQYSAILQRQWNRGAWSYDLLAVPAYAEDAGKSSSDFPERIAGYPRERHGLVKFGVTAPSGWRLSTFVHGWDLETEVVGGNGVVNDSFDFGARWEQRAELGDGISLRYGLDSFNRRSVDSLESVTEPGPGEPESIRSLEGAELDEAGLFGAASGNWGKALWQAGGRFSWARQQNGSDSARDLSAWNGFGGLTWLFTERLELRAGIDSGLRFPSLSELFYTGTTGRGSVIGNPELSSERSLNSEISLRWLGKRLFLSGLLFRNRVDDYIERYLVDPDLVLYTYNNLSSGTISGFELQGLYLTAQGWKLFWAGHRLHGRDAAGLPLSDIPPDEIQVGFSHEMDDWTFRSRLALRSAKADISGEEQAIPSATLLSASASYQISPQWKISLSANNLLDEEYYPSADNKAPLAQGRSFALRLSWNGAP